MSVGFPQDKNTIDGLSGNAILGVRNALRDVKSFQAWLGQAAVTDAALVALGYTQADVNLLRASFTDLGKLSDIANAAATQSSTSNFFFNAGQLLGPR